MIMAATILVDKDLCTKCGICSTVCTAGIITPADDFTFPTVSPTKEGKCVRCGHCEAFCPAEALTLNFRPEEKTHLWAEAGALSAKDLGIYLKKRRSVRHFLPDPVPRDIITEILGVAQYAPSGGNGQPVQWLVIQDPQEVHRLAGLTIDYMRTLLHSPHPMSGYFPSLIARWERYEDPICRGAPHLVLAHVPENYPIGFIDALIALTHFDLAAPAFGLGCCWAGFLSMAAPVHEPLQKALALPAGRKYAYGLMFGYPKYKVYGIPRRNTVQVRWR
jgi:nitroreductase/NAD-dependent dihydropyrimidine dehydrogenase PreA subunit